MAELYRRITARMWADADFRSLSGPQPNAQDLWVYLLTGLHVTPVPGLYPATLDQLARGLRWPLDGFLTVLRELNPHPIAFQIALPIGYAEGYREAYAEAYSRDGRQGSSQVEKPTLEKVWFEADWEAGVIWVPNAFFHNEPQSLKVVKGWKKHVDLVPECPLRDNALEELRGYCHAKGPKWGKAFDEAFAKPTRKAIRKPKPSGAVAGSGAVTGELRERARARATPPQTKREGEPNGARDPEPEPPERPALGGGLAFEVREGWAEAYHQANAGAPPRLIGKQLEAAVQFADDVARLHCKQPREAARAIATATLQSSERDVRTWGLTKIDPYAAQREVRRGVLRPAPADAFKATNIDDIFGAEPPK